MTVGAAGAINVAMTSLLDPGDEVIILAPYFVEYLFYVGNHGGVLRVVETTEDFDLDLQAVARALTPRTKALIINTPNNPTGRIYSQAKLDALGTLLAEAEQRHAKEIHLVVDTPYAKITYDGLTNPLLFKTHPSVLIAHSYSKDLGVAGQRIGFLAINPASPDREALRAACTITNRTLGFVNAPALMQLAVEKSIGACVDTAIYHSNRGLLCNGLAAAGYAFFKPQGAFYVFAKTPISDDIAFTQELQRENILVVPGSGFGRRGHMRIAFCVAPETIEQALPRFARVIERVKAG
jgi:aspartate aminotransferase